MNVLRTDIEGLVIIEPKVHGDERGYFFESFSERDFAAGVAETSFVQDNESRSVYGVVRGLHFQRPPHSQAKLVRVVKGRVLDVAVHRDIEVRSVESAGHHDRVAQAQRTDDVVADRGRGRGGEGRHGRSSETLERIINEGCNGLICIIV